MTMLCILLWGSKCFVNTSQKILSLTSILIFGESAGWRPPSQWAPGKNYFEIGGGDLSFRISLKNELCSTDCTQRFWDCSSLGIISNIRFQTQNKPNAIRGCSSAITNTFSVLKNFLFKEWFQIEQFFLYILVFLNQKNSWMISHYSKSWFIFWVIVRWVILFTPWKTG